MKILILGNSSILRRKIYPSLKKIKNLSIEVASKNKIYSFSKIKMYKSYKKAIEKTDSKLVYISLINSEHYKWAKYSLMHSKHVIIDKPFTLSLDKTNSLVELASKKKLFISEAIVFHKHSRFKKLLSNINYRKKINISASFHIPKLEKNNFRNKKKYGGGCFNDMAPYASFLIYLFFCNKYYKIIKSGNKKKANIKKNFNITVENRKVKLSGSFKFNSEYKNEILIENCGKQYYIDNAFSPPIDKITELSIVTDRIQKIIKLKLKKENAFDKYFSEIFKLIKNKKYNFFYHEIKKIAEIKKKIS